MLVNEVLGLYMVCDLIDNLPGVLVFPRSLAKSHGKCLQEGAFGERLAHLHAKDL